jgi:integrase
MGTTKGKSQLAANTIHKYHRLLNILFNRAVKWGLASCNPCERTDPPKFERHQQEIYDEETTGKFLILLEDEEVKYRAMTLITLSTGCRRGETLGLQWHHINFDTNTINIEQAGQYLPGEGIFKKDPKTQSSKRTVTIPEIITVLLKKHKADQSARRLKLGTKKTGGKWEGAESADDDFVFTTWNGKQVHPDSMNTWLRKLITKHELPPLTPKSFRHMAATYLITSGTDIRTVAGKLGHANSTTTTVVYSHLVKSAEKETADKMHDYIKQATEKAKEKQKKQAK